MQEPWRGMQIGPRTPRVAALSSLLASAMQMPAYSFLRTSAQLGYDVDVEPCAHCGICGLTLTVCGGSNAAGAATWKVEEFLDDFGQVLATMPKQDFAELKENAIMELVCIPVALLCPDFVQVPTLCLLYAIA